MKRLKRIAASKKLYHGTSLSALKQIAADGGIVPNKGGGAGVSHLDGQSGGGRVFLGTDLETGELYAGYAAEVGDVPVVLELTLNEDVLLPDNDDMPDATTWQETAESLKQVTVEGKINTGDITKVYFYTTHLEGATYQLTSVAEGSFGQWEKIVEDNYEKIYGQAPEGETSTTQNTENVTNEDPLVKALLDKGLDAKLVGSNVVSTNVDIKAFREGVYGENIYDDNIYGSISGSGDITLSNGQIQDGGIKFEFDYGSYVNVQNSSYDSFLRFITNGANLKKNLDAVFGNSGTFDFGDVEMEVDELKAEF